MTGPVRPSRRPGATDARAALARAGYLLLRDPSMQVDFEIHHVADRPGRLAEIVSRPDARPFGHVLASGAHGTAVVIGTWLGEPMGPPAPGDEPSSRVRETMPDGRVFAGSAHPNPAFQHDASERLDGIVDIGGGDRLRLGQARALRGVLREVAEIAREEGTPLQLVQCPAQRPGGEGTREDRSAASALRFSYALQEPGARVRLRIAERLERFCAAAGYGFWLADTAVGLAGAWFQVRPGEPSEEQGDEPACSCLPVTFVGPARLGTTDSVISYLSAFPEIGIVSCSMIPLDELTFIHLQLTVDPAAEAVRELAARSDGNTGVIEGLPQLVAALLGTDPGQATLERLVTARDYQMVLGPVLPVTGADDRMPLWVSWRMSGSDLRLPLSTLQDALAVEGLRADRGATSVAYLACRDVGGAVVRAKGKLAVSEPLVRGAGTTPAAFARAVQDRWAVEVAAAGGQGRCTDLQVSLHEAQLSRWSSGARGAAFTRW